MEQLADGGIRVEALAAEYQAQAEHWAVRLGLPLQDASAAFAVQVGETGLQIQQLGPQAPGPVRVDFVEGAAAHRRVFGGGSGQMIAKAVGIAQGVRPRVLDATAGLGKDAFVLASLGCQMQLIERQPLVAALLEDGLARAAMTWMPRHCWRPPWPWPATGWWSNARARRRSSTGPSPAIAWKASRAATTSTPRKPSSPD